MTDVLSEALPTYTQIRQELQDLTLRGLFGPAAGAEEIVDQRKRKNSPLP